MKYCNLIGRLCKKTSTFCLIGSLFLVWGDMIAQGESITDKNIEFIKYPGFADQHSTWNDIGYSSLHNKVIIGVTNHKDKIAIYDYDVDSKVMSNKGFISDMANLRRFQWQGKIHSKIMEGADGIMYFSTDGGEVREEYLMNNPQGYAGGFFMSWDPKENKLTNLGMGLQYESIKDIDLAPNAGLIYAISYPQAHLLVYNLKQNKLKDMGRLASTHVPRVLFTDQWENCYYVDWRQRLVKYELESDKLVFAEEALPAFQDTPGEVIVTGVTAYAKDQQKGIIYLVTYGAKIVAFYPQEKGVGRFVDLGGVYDLEDGDLWKPYVPNLGIGENGKLYYIIGGHGNFVKEDKTVMIEFDPEIGTKRILYEFPIVEIGEATGSDVRDKEGNIYFAGRLTDNKTVDANQEFDYSKPFMIRFNPEKAVK